MDSFQKGGSKGSGSSFQSSYIAYPSDRQKRKKARIQVRFDGFVESPGYEPQECLVSSLGTGGLTVSTRATFYPGELVRVSFHLQEMNIRCECEIVRVTGKELGVKFVQIDDESLELIQSYIFKETFNKS